MYGDVAAQGPTSYARGCLRRVDVATKSSTEVPKRLMTVETLLYSPAKADSGVLPELFRHPLIVDSRFSGNDARGGSAFPQPQAIHFRQTWYEAVGTLLMGRGQQAIQ